MIKNTNKKNIISIVIPEFVSQGGPRVVINIANILAENGYKVHIIACRKPEKIPFFVSPLVTLHYATKFNNKILAYLVYPFILPFILSGDILISTYYYVRLPTKLAAYFKKIPHFYFIQGVECFRKGGLLNILNSLCKISLFEENIFASNKYLSNEVFNKTGRKINHINVGPSNIFFNKQVSIEKKEYDLIYFPRKENFKRLDLFLDLFSYSLFTEKKWKIIMVTQDSLLALDLKKMMLPFCEIVSPSDDDELINLIDQSKLMFFTSEYEGLGLPPLECMIRGLPVVTYKTYPLTEYFSSNELSSLLVDDTLSAVLIINEILASNEKYLHYSNLCKEFVQSAFSDNYAFEFNDYIQNNRG